MFNLLQRHHIATWPIVLGMVCLFLVALNPWLKPWLRYDEGAIQHGEYWRLLTAHFMHLGWMHGLLNVMGFCLIAYIYPAGKAINWLAFYVITSVLISLYMLIDSGTYYYVGASGVLHGLLILGAFFSRALDVWRRYLLIFIVIAKLFWEQSRYYVDHGVGEAIGGFVYVDAHLVGGMCALGLVSIFLLKNRLRFPTYH